MRFRDKLLLIVGTSILLWVLLIWGASTFYGWAQNA